MANALLNLSVTQLKRALEIREQIDALASELNDITGSPYESSRVNGPARGRKRFSTAARRRMAAAQRARRAGERGGSAGARRGRRGRGKKRFSPAVRARLSAAA